MIKNPAIKLSLFVIFFVLINQIQAQKDPIKFGKITLAEVEKSVYKIDTSAPAIILCDYCYFSSGFTTKRNLRIKILKKEGLKYGTQPVSARKGTVRGITYNIENGLLIKTKLKKESIFEERNGPDKVTMPNVKVGSVIEIEYQSGFKDEWKFQWDIPVLYSEIRVPNSSYVNFRKNLFGFEPLKINTGTRFVAENMPAFVPEPFINSKENYITRLEIEIIEINHPDYYKDIAKDWDDVSFYLLDKSNFGSVLRKKSYSKSIAKEIDLNNYTYEEKIKKAFEKVREIKWNEKVSLYHYNLSVGKSYEEKTGNSTEINFALIQLLNELNIETYPLVLSTRKNGMLSIVYPSLDKLNYVAAYALLRDTAIILDATEEMMPYHLIPKRVMNWQGYVIYDKRNIERIDINPAYKDKETIFYNLSLALTDLNLIGSYSSKKDDYAAFNFRKKLKSYNSREEYIDNLISNNTGLHIIDSEIKNIDSIYIPVIELHQVEIEDQVIAIDDELYVMPLLFERITENPFKTEERLYPIDYGYCREKSITVMIKIPENCEVIELPESVSISTPYKGAYFIYQISSFGSMIQVSCKYGINKALFMQDEYSVLKEYYSKGIEKMAEPIILKVN